MKQYNSTFNNDVGMVVKHNQEVIKILMQNITDNNSRKGQITDAKQSKNDNKPCSNQSSFNLSTAQLSSSAC